MTTRTDAPTLSPAAAGMALRARTERVARDLRSGAAGARLRGDLSSASMLDEGADEIERLARVASPQWTTEPPVQADADGLPPYSSLESQEHFRRIVTTATANGVRTGLDQAHSGFSKACKARGLNPAETKFEELLAVEFNLGKSESFQADVRGFLVQIKPDEWEALPDIVQSRIASLGQQMFEVFKATRAALPEPDAGLSITAPPGTLGGPPSLIEVQIADGPTVTHLGWVLRQGVVENHEARQEPVSVSPPGYAISIDPRTWATLSPQVQAMVRQIGMEVVRITSEPIPGRDEDPVEEVKREMLERRVERSA